VLQATKEKKEFSIFIFDIDYFKNYNDKNGHQAGDEALRITANLLKENFRSGDIKARYGGEEFIVLMRDTQKQQAHELADRFRVTIEKFAFPHEENQPNGCLTVSGGIATFPVDGNNIKEIIEKADEALYMSKGKGRNRVMLAQTIDFSDEMGQGS
jgi:diguanylate cyclase (GGDEF)-like protein